MKRETIHGTTILAVLKDGKACIGGDGQVTLGHNILKAGAKKVRRLYKDKILAGFAGSVADAIALFEKFEGKINEANGDLKRGAVDFTREWRSDRVLRRLDAMLIVVDTSHIYIISGSGDVIEPDDGIAVIGSGGHIALASARALIRKTDLNVREIVQESLNIASEICIYTNNNIIIEEL